MKCNFIHIKLAEKSNISSNNNKIIEFFKLSIGKNIINLNNAFIFNLNQYFQIKINKPYNTGKKESSNKNLEISYFKKYIRTNIGKMIYRN